MHQHLLDTGQILNPAAPTQRLINAAAQEHERKYTSTTARWDSNPTADQQVCDVGACSGKAPRYDKPSLRVG